MINSAIIEDLHDRNQRYMYISFSPTCKAKYAWTNKLTSKPSDFRVSDGSQTFSDWMRYTSIKYRIIGVFTDSNFTDEASIDDYPELFV